VKQGFKLIAALVLFVSAAALTMPASWMDAGAQSQTAPVAVRARLATKGNDKLVSPVVTVRRSRVDIPEELSLLLVGAALVGLAGVLRRDEPVDKAPHGLRRSRISGVATSRGLAGTEWSRRSS
jgi:hypothetical protein